MRRAERIVERARALVGTRFRPHGRGRAGLDCVGVIGAALQLEPPRDYALRGGDLAALERALTEAGLGPVAEREAGDVVLLWSGPGQLHLGVWTGDGLVHADAGLKRVVERPGEPPWRIAGVWRLLDFARDERPAAGNGGRKIWRP